MRFRDFLKPSLDHPDPKIRVRAVAKTSDQNILREIVLSDTDARVRKRAASKIEDKILLCEIAKSDKNSEVRITATKRIADPKALIEIAVSDKEPEVRMQALQTLALSGLTAIAALIDNRGNQRVRQEDVNTLSLAIKAEYLIRLGTFDANTEVRSKAIEMLISAYGVLGILEGSEVISEGTSEFSIQRTITLLEKIAIEDPSTDVRAKAKRLAEGGSARIGPIALVRRELMELGILHAEEQLRSVGQEIRDLVAESNTLIVRILEDISTCNQYNATLRSEADGIARELRDCLE
jgi:hypothetical protein